MSENPCVLIVDDEQLMRNMLHEAIGAFGHEVMAVKSALEAKVCADKIHFDLLVTDINMPGENGLELVKHFKKTSPETSVIVITAFPDNERIKMIEELEVSTFLVKPFTIRQLKYSVLGALENHKTARANKKIEHELHASRDFGLVGVSKYADNLRREIALMASGDFPVLIQGESGTGKEVIAHAIHNNSTRNNARIITINCAAIPRHLEESEFFGHARGAFTGAHAKKIGIIESAANSTLFLDEIGELSLGVQAKLLRVLDTGEYSRIGEISTQTVDIRIISATNRSLEEMVTAGIFRKDLYYRLKGATVTTQPLSHHRDDIPHLIRHFLKLQDNTKHITPDAMELLCAYAWPGNIRELKHSIQLLCSISKAHKRINSEAVRSGLHIEGTSAPNIPFNAAKSAFERAYFSSLLRKHEGNMTRIASEAGLHRPNLLRKLKELDLSPEEFRTRQ